MDTERAIAAALAEPEPVIQNVYETQWNEWSSKAQNRYPTIQFPSLSLSIGEDKPYNFTFADLESGNTFKVVGGNSAAQPTLFTKIITFNSIQVDHNEYLFSITILDGRLEVMKITFCAEEESRQNATKLGWDLRTAPGEFGYIRSFTKMRIS